MPKIAELLGASPPVPTPISYLHASVTNQVSKYAHLTLIKLPNNSELHGAPPLHPHRGFAPGPHAILRPICFALSDRNYLRTPPPSPTSTLKNVPRGLHVTCKRGDDADFLPPPPHKKKILLITSLLPRSSQFVPAGHEKKSPPRAMDTFNALSKCSFVLTTIYKALSKHAFQFFKLASFTQLA